MALLIQCKWRSGCKLKQKGVDLWNDSLAAAFWTMWFLIDIPEYKCSKSDAVVLSSSGLMIWVQPKTTNFSMKTVWRDYKSLPVILQFEGQIEELKKEKMLYQKRGTLHFRFSSLIIPISEEHLGLNLMCILMLLGSVLGFTKWKCHMRKACAYSHLARWTCSSTPASRAGYLHTFSFCPLYWNDSEQSYQRQQATCAVAMCLLSSLLCA